MAFLLRDRKAYNLPLSPAIESILTALRDPPRGSTADYFIAHIQELFFLLWSSPWKPTEANSIGDPTVCYIALSSIRADTRWAHPKDVTPTIARLTYCLRLVALRRAHGQPDVVVGLENLSHMYTEKVDSTFNSIRSLQHLASSIAYATVSKPITHWIEDEGKYRTLIFAGEQIHMTALRNLGRSAILETFNFMFEKVFLGQSIYIPPTFIRDDLSCDTPGYSFLTDPRNSFILPYQKSLLDAILKDDRLSDEFIKGFHPNSGKPLWNLPRLRVWYMHYCELQLKFACLIQVLGGAPARGSELLCLQYRNTPSQTRGLYKMHNNWIILCQYTKTSALSGQDKFIPHGIDAFTGDMLFHSLVCALPLAQMFAAILYPQDVSVQKLLHTYLFPNSDGTFHTDQLSNSLKLISANALGVGLTTSQWRQFFIAVRRKHCPDFETILDFESVDTVGALQSGHSRHTENRLYGLTPDSFTHHSEDVIKVFLEYTKKWARFMNIPAGHLSLSYRLLSSPDTYDTYLPVDDGTVPLPAELRLNPAGIQLDAIHQSTQAIANSVSHYSLRLRLSLSLLTFSFPLHQTSRLYSMLDQQTQILSSMAGVSQLFDWLS